MRKILVVLTTLLLPIAAQAAGGAASVSRPAQDTAVKVGDTAPDWKLTGSDGKEYKLSDFKGKQGVIGPGVVRS